MDTARRFYDGDDRGSIVLGWLTKLIVFLAIAGVVAFDGIAITAARLGASDDAYQAASVAAEDFRQHHDVQSAYNAALGTIVSDTETMPAGGFSVDSDGTVHLVLRRTITTVLVQKIGPLKKYAAVTIHAKADPPTL